MSREDDIKKQINEHTLRLQKLKEQQASFGLHTPPHIIIEIEKIETEINTLREELKSLPKIVRQNPYRGLSAFREADADVFFGRETFTTQLVKKVRQQTLVAVVGSSGSGKSSVVFAGLMPHLQAEGGWLIADFRPKREPFNELAAKLVPLLDPDLTERLQLKEIKGLATDLEQGDLSLERIVTRILEKSPDADKFLLIVDQFEELYTLCPEPEIRRQFLDVLLATGEQVPLHLVLTLRADFMGQTLDYRPFADALSEAIVMLGPMETEELRQAIEKPAGKQDARFETGLVERILDDVGYESGQLPLLEFALTALWKKQKRGELTHKAYEAIGRVEGALSRYADQVFESLSETEQEQAHRVLVQLVRPGEGTEDTRRLARRDEFGEADWLLVKKLADERLVITGLDPDKQEAAEVVHEALIRNWPQLCGWLNEDRRFRIWQERLRAALRQWQASQQDEGALLRGAPLAEAEIWLDERGGDLTEKERNFIQASVSLRERILTEREAQRRRERAGRFFRWLAIALGIILLLLAARWGWSLNCLSISQWAGFGIHCPAINLFGINLFRADLSEVGLREALKVGPWEVDLDQNLSGANLSGANLSSLNLASTHLEGANLSGADLSRTDLGYTHLEGADLHGANLKGASLATASLTQTNLSGADLSGANLRGAHLSEANLSGANLSKDYYSGDSTYLSSSDLREANLRGANLHGADMNWVDLRGAYLGDADLHEADLDEADLRKADLSGANLSNADLRKADLRGAIVDDNTRMDEKWQLVCDIVNKPAPGRNLYDAELDYAYLVGANLRQANLTVANLEYSNLAGVNLSGAELSGADLSGADLSRADLSNANLSEANLYGAVLTQTNLSNANLSGTDLRAANLSGADLSGGADLRRADLQDAVLTQTNLSKANLSEANLRRADLRRADLSGADLRRADLREANIDDTTKIDHKWRLVWNIVTSGEWQRDLGQADLSEANLYGADLSRADLSNANLSGADLHDAYLREADLTRAKLLRANLNGAKLTGANLSGADLSGADLSEADLRQARLHGADLAGVLLTGCTYDEETTWPEGIDPVKAGAKFSD